MHRRRFVIIGALALAGCRSSRIFGSLCGQTFPLPQHPTTPGILPPTARDIWVVTDYTGPQAGTKDRPFSIRPNEIDQFMNTVTADPSTWTVNAPGHFLGRGAREWGPLAGAAWRIPSNCVFDGHGGTLELDYQGIPDDYVRSEPWHLLCTSEGEMSGKTGEAAWRAVHVGETLRNITLIGNYSKMVDRWQAAGQKLLISGAILQGHAVTYDNVHLRDFGALGGEAFPLIISGCMAGPDRNALTTVDPSHMFDEESLGLPRSRISNCTFDDYHSALSNNQVSVFLITGSMGSVNIASPWAEIGPWQQTYRRNPIIENCQGFVRDGRPGINQCQLATIYQCRGAEISGCLSRGFQAGVYGDFYSSFALDMHHNDFEALRPIALLTSNLGPGMEQYSHADASIRSNTLRCLPTDEWWHGGVLLMKLMDGPESRYIRNVSVDDNDFIMVGMPLAENVAIRAEGVDGLHVYPTNRYTGFDRLYAIKDDCTGVQISQECL